MVQLRRKSSRITSFYTKPLLLLLILIAIAAGPVKGQIADSSAYMRSAMPDWLWGCDTDLGTVTFDEFMTAMKDVYTDCKTKDNCGAAGCRKMVLESGGAPGDYYQVDQEELKNNGLEEYIANDFLRYVTILCSGDDLFCGSSEIDVYHKPKEKFETRSVFSPIPPTTTVVERERASDNIVCAYWRAEAILASITADGGFYVANGAKITITAKKVPATLTCAGNSTDMKVIVDGGTYTTLR